MQGDVQSGRSDKLLKSTCNQKRRPQPTTPAQVSNACAKMTASGQGCPAMVPRYRLQACKTNPRNRRRELKKWAEQ